MGTYAVFEDVAGAYESVLPEGKRAWIENLIGKAERLLLKRVPSLAARIAAGTQDVQSVIDAVVAAVLRVVRNPTGFASETEANYAYTVDRTVAGGKLFYTGDDLVLVQAMTAGGYGRLFHSPITRTSTLGSANLPRIQL